MRTLDQPAPVFTPHPIGPDTPVGRWPAIPRVVIERLPVYAYGWDDENPDTVWQTDTGMNRIWDSPTSGAGYVDAVCDFQAIEIEAGNPDELNLFASAKATVTLDNRDGDWSIYDGSGRLVYYAPGRRLHLLADYAGVSWWLFSGVIDTWDVNIDGSVTIEAHDRFSILAQEIGAFTPGAAGDKPAARLGAIAAAVGDTGPVRLDPGDVTLTRQSTERSPLEEMQVVALSDGGLLYVDADGTLTYRDRLWPRGRSDQPTVDVFSDNVCEAPAVVWDVELSNSDDHLATRVHLANVAGTVVDAVTADPFWTNRPYPLTHPDPDQWTTAGEGQALATVLLDLYDDPKVGVREFKLHLLDPQQDLWRTGIDRRLGDRIRFLHDYVAVGGAAGTFDVTLIVSTITHEITPEGWVVGIGTGPAVDATAVQRWDRTTWTWDDPNAHWDY